MLKHMTNDDTELVDQRVAYIEDVSWRMLELINNARDIYKLPPLKVHPALVKAAQSHSEEMAQNGSLSHYGENGSTWADRVAQAGYVGADLTNVLENIAAGQNSSRR